MEHTDKATITQMDPEPRKRMSDMQRGRIYMGDDAAPSPDHSIAEAEPAETVADAEPAGDLPAGAEDDSTEANVTDPETDTPEPAEPARPPRHKTLEDAEKSYLNAQRKITQQAEENARLKRELEAERKEREAQAAQQAAAKKEAFTTSRYEKAMEALQDLDEYDPDYKAKAARVWADCHNDIAAFGSTAASTTSPPGEPSSAPADDPSGGTVPPEGPQEGGETPDRQAVLRRIQARLEEQKVSAEFGLDDPVFIGYASKAPTSRDGAPLPFEAQVDWAIEQTKGHYQKVRAKIMQQAGQPMGRSGPSVRKASVPGGPPNQRVTLGEARAKALERRTI